MTRIILYFLGLCLVLSCVSVKAMAATEVNVRNFGAVGDGVADDGPAFQRALDALAAAGGGTLFVPEGQYAILTPVAKNFTGLATSITITGVESTKPVTPPTATGDQLAEGLDLLSEIYPRTGVENPAFDISGLQTLVVKELAFVGTEGAITDAANALLLTDIDKAQVKHSEFAALATFADAGAIIEAVRCDLEITQSKFLGSTGDSGRYIPVVQNLEWRGITVTDTIFLDYGLRTIYGKTGLGAPVSWINIGNAAAVTNRSPRREVVIRNTFLDEGGWWGLTSLPYRYTPASAPIDLIYITGLKMNVGNFGQYGNLFYDARSVLIEKSLYGWSRNAAAAIAVNRIDTAIFDQLTCIADADHLYADNRTRQLHVINSVYAQIDSEAEFTNAFNTENEEDDPVQYVHNRFASSLDRDADPAALFYWSNALLECSQDSTCQTKTKDALNNYLAGNPTPTFSITGIVTSDTGNPLADTLVTLSGSQNVTTKTDSAGRYLFSNLPTSGVYTINPIHEEFSFTSPNGTLTTPTGDRTANFSAKLKMHVIRGTVKLREMPVAGVTVALSGSASGSAVTDQAGQYAFSVTRHGTYTLTPSKEHYDFKPATVTDLRADTQLDFAGNIEKRTLRGRVLTTKDEPFAGVEVVLTGPVTLKTLTASDGSYSFAADYGCDCTVTPAKANYFMTPAVQTFINVTTDTVATDFRAGQLPVLLTAADSDRALALELTSFLAEPFSLTMPLLSAGRNRTRIIVFATDLGLLPGEGIEALTAEAEDMNHLRYPLRVEFMSPLAGSPISQIVLRLGPELVDSEGDLLVSVTVHGLTSNRVRTSVE